MLARNGASILDQNLLDFTKKTYGSHLRIVMRLKYCNNSQGSGVYPQKPGIFLVAPLTVEAGCLYQLS